MTQGTSIVAALLFVSALLHAAAAASQSVPIGRYVELPFGLERGHPYAMTAADGQRSGRVHAKAPAARPIVRWERQLPQRRLLPPTLLSDGTLVVGHANGLVALSAAGAPLWEAAIGQVRFTPSVTPGGDLLVSTYEGKLWLVSPGGAARSIDGGTSLTGLPLVLDGGLIVVGGRDGQVHVLDLEGTELLRVASGAREPSWTARVGGGLLASAGPDRELLLLSLHAGRERAVALAERVTAGLAVDAQGTTWLVGDQGTLMGISPNGKTLATVSLGTRGATAPVIGRDGGLRLGLPSREVVCIGRDGVERWRRGLDGRPSALLLDGDDTLLVASARGTLYAIDAQGEQRWRAKLNLRRAVRPVLAADGTVYVVSSDGMVKAVR